MDRRGLGEWQKHTRFIEYCSGCASTSVFELQEIEGENWLVCIGDQRQGRGACGRKHRYTQSRLYGVCGKCNQVRRSFRTPDGKTYCVTCMAPVTETKEFV